MELVVYCEQAESTRDTCSRDPANCMMNILTVVWLIFFQKRNQNGTKTKKKKGENTERLYVQGLVEGLTHAVIGGY